MGQELCPPSPISQRSQLGSSLSPAPNLGQWVLLGAQLLFQSSQHPAGTLLQGDTPCTVWGDHSEEEEAGRQLLGQGEEGSNTNHRIPPWQGQVDVRRQPSLGIPGHRKNPHSSPKKKQSALEGLPVPPKQGGYPQGDKPRLHTPPSPSWEQAGAPTPEPAWPKQGREAGLGPGTLCSSVVKFGKDDPQLVSENTVSLSLLPGAL